MNNKIKQALLILKKNPYRFLILIAKNIFGLKTTSSYRYSTYAEINLLQKYARGSKIGIIEIGTLDGGTIREVALCTNVPIFSIDPLIPDSMDQNLIGTKEKILKNMSFYKKFTFIHDYSFNTVKKFTDRFDLIWIDGDHNYDGCKKDFDDWFPLLEKGGYVLFHDSAPVISVTSNYKGYDGPIRVCSELKNDPRVTFIECVDSISVFKKNA
jgi:spermidine synthase